MKAIIRVEEDQFYLKLCIGKNPIFFFDAVLPSPLPQYIFTNNNDLEVYWAYKVVGG